MKVFKLKVWMEIDVWVEKVVNKNYRSYWTKKGEKR